MEFTKLLQKLKYKVIILIHKSLSKTNSVRNSVPRRILRHLEPYVQNRVKQKGDND